MRYVAVWVLPILLVTCVPALFLVFSRAESDAGQVAELLMGAATISSIVFAVIIFVESTVLREHIRELEGRLSKALRVAESKIENLSDLHLQKSYNIAMFSLEMHYQNIWIQEINENDLVLAFNRLKSAELQVHLSHPTPLSLWKAIEVARKLGSDEFLRIERQIWEGTKGLNKSDKRKVRDQYHVVKTRIIAQMRQGGSID